MLYLAKRALLILVGAIVLMLAVSWILAWQIRFLNSRLMPDPNAYVYDDGSRQWLVQVYRRVGAVLICAYVNPAMDKRTLDRPAYSPPGWSALQDPPTFTTGFNYDEAYGWPVAAFAWSRMLPKMEPRASAITVTRGIVVSGGHKDDQDLIVLPTRPVWTGILTNLFFYVPVCWGVLKGFHWAQARIFARLLQYVDTGEGEHSTEVA